MKTVWVICATVDLGLGYHMVKGYDSYDKAKVEFDRICDEAVAQKVEQLMKHCNYTKEQADNWCASVTFYELESVGVETRTHTFKTGSSEFYRGYTDGFEGRDFTSGPGYDYDEGFDKGSDDSELCRSERYRYVGSVQPTKSHKVASQPKLGTTEFYRGYSDGFYDHDMRQGMSDAYYEGLDKGLHDASLDGQPERYSFMETSSNGWPFPSDRQDPEVD
jgi:hypothetical protein